MHASVKSRRREEERAAQGYDSTREASEATAAAGARVFSCAPRRGTPGARRGRPCAPAWAVNEVGLHEVGFAGGGSGLARGGLAGRGGSGARSAVRRVPLLGARRRGGGLQRRILSRL